MKTKLEDINIMPSYGKINEMSAADARICLYNMQSIAASMAFELFLNESYGVSSLGKSEHIEGLLQSFRAASIKSGEKFGGAK